MSDWIKNNIATILTIAAAILFAGLVYKFPIVTLVTFWGVLLFLITIYIILGGKFNFFTKLEENRAKFIYRGGNLWRIIINQVGKRLEGKKIIDGKEEKSWINSFFGYWFMGFSPTTNIHPFLLKSHYTIAVQDDGSFQKTWFANPARPIEYDLWLTMPFTFRFGGLEGGTADKAFRANLDLACRFEVVDPYRAAILMEGNLFSELDSILESRLAKLVASFDTYAQLRAADRTEGPASIFAPAKLKEKSPEELAIGTDPVLNNELISHTGLRLIAINAPSLSTNRDLEKATEAKTIAEANAAALVAEATGIRDADKIKAEGKAAYTAAELKAYEESPATGLDKTLATAAKIWGKGGNS